MGNFAKELARFGPSLPAAAALASVGLMLPYLDLERQPVHQAPRPQQLSWVREALQRAQSVLESDPPPLGDKLYVLSTPHALDDVQTFPRQSTEEVVLEAEAFAMAAVIAFRDDNGTYELEGWPYDSNY